MTRAFLPAILLAGVSLQAASAHVHIHIRSGHSHGYGGHYHGYGGHCHGHYHYHPYIGVGAAYAPVYSYPPPLVVAPAYPLASPYTPEPAYPPAPLAANIDAGGLTGSPAGQTQIQVIVPDPEARVFFDGAATSSLGRVRSYYPPALPPGSNYSYKVSTSWERDGKTFSDVRLVQVQAGQTGIVDFTQPATETLALPVPPTPRAVPVNDPLPPPPPPQ